MTQVIHIPPAFQDYTQHPRIPVTSVSTRSRNLTDHHHMLLISKLPSTSPNLTQFTLLSYNIIFFHSTLECLVCHQQSLLCLTLFSEYLLLLLPLIETWLSLSCGRCLFFYSPFASGCVNRVGLGFHISKICG